MQRLSDVGTPIGITAATIGYVECVNNILSRLNRALKPRSHTIAINQFHGVEFVNAASRTQVKRTSGEVFIDPQNPPGKAGSSSERQNPS